MRAPRSFSRRASARSPRTECPNSLRVGVLNLLRATVVCWLASAWLAFGQIAATNGLSDPAELAGPLHLRLTEAQTELSALSSASSASTNLPPGATASEVTEQRLMAESLVRAYQEHLDQLAGWAEGRRRQKESEQQAATWRGFAEPPPYSILLLDELRDSVQSLSANVTASETTLDVLRTISDEAAVALKKSDERSRLLAEQLESEQDPARATRLTWLRGLEHLRNRLVTASAALNETRCLKVAAELAGHRQRAAFVRRQLAIASQRVRFSEADLRQVLDGLETGQGRLKKEIAEAELEAENRQRELTALRPELPPAVTATAATGQVQLAHAGASAEALADLRRAQVETSQQRLALLRRLADLAHNEHGLWQMRFAAFGTRDLARLREGYQRLEHLEHLIRIVRPHFRQQLELTASLIAEQRNRSHPRTGAQPDPAVLDQMMACFQQREDLAQRGLRGLDQFERLVLRWKEALDQQRAQLPATTRVRDLFSEFSSFATKLWQLELFVAEDTITVDGQAISGRRSVTVGKIVLALLLLAVGYWLSSLLARFLERLAIKRLKVERNQANLIRRWVRVVLLLALAVFSLVSVKIPLTVFAFLGGALAIGLGFGTQNLLKNFISGIIILFERPFRVGDVLDLGGHRGSVVSIGIRSSVLKLGDGAETLIPNSTLLENNLTNWTYSDRKVRFSLTVGVAYGSDTRRVAHLLTEAAERHGLVQKEPAPQVFFQEFGDNALTFEMRYWLDVVQQNSAQIGSDLRHMIAGTFAEHGIVMAFPQRDLHLDAARPLQIQIVPAERPSAPAQPVGPQVKGARDRVTALGQDQIPVLPTAGVARAVAPCPPVGRLTS